MSAVVRLNSGGAVAYQETGDVTANNPVSTVATASQVALVTATAKNVTSLALGVGTWKVRGQIDYALAAATATRIESSLSSVTNAAGTQAGDTVIGPEAYNTRVLATTTATQEEDQLIQETLVTIPTAGATVYLVAKATFSAGAIGAFGTIQAVKIA